MCLSLRANQETLLLANLTKLSLEATADGSLVDGVKEFRKYSGTGFTRVVLGTRLVFTDGATWRFWVQPGSREYRTAKELIVSFWLAEDPTTTGTFLV